MEDVEALHSEKLVSVTDVRLSESSMSMDIASSPGRQVTFQSRLPLIMVGGRPAAVTTERRRMDALATKRVMDVVLAASALVFLAPLFLLAAIAIVIESRGPILFRQQREGLNGTLFSAYKFRSMRVELGDASGVSFTKVGDKRITRVGAFLRRTSIDELPQLINVLLGQMSLVGPRPHVPNMLGGGKLYKDLVPYYHERLTMLPGITGWAQANGYRGDASDARLAKARVHHDLAYIQNFSIMLDLRILWLTVCREVVGGNGR